MTSPVRATFDRLVRVEILLWNRLDDAARRGVGLPLGRLEVLRAVAELPGCRVQDVAARLLITVGAASKLVDRLEASGHCQRHPNPDDRRSSLLTVTAVGQGALTQADALLEPLLAPAFAAVHLPDLERALAGVEQALTAEGEVA